MLVEPETLTSTFNHPVIILRESVWAIAESCRFQLPVSAFLKWTCTWALGIIRSVGLEESKQKHWRCVRPKCTAHWFCRRQYDEQQFWVIYFRICWVHVKLLPTFSITVMLVLRPKPAFSKYSIFNLKLYEATNSWISYYYHRSPELYKSCRWLKVTNIIIIIICLWLPNGSEGPRVHWEHYNVSNVLSCL